MSGMELRPARPDDAPAVARIRIAGWQAYAGILDAAYVTSTTFADDARSGAVRWLATLDALGRNPEGVTMLVHERAGAVDGWVSFGPDRSGDHGDDGADGEVWGLYVDPASWGSGTARHLLRAATDQLHATGFSSVVLWCLDGNERAHRFYGREGWVLDGARATRDFGPAGTAEELRRREPDRP
jgi:GNAT superfamily N-acetyltransferase